MGKPFTETEKRRFERIKKLTLDVIRKMDNQKMLNYQRYKDMFDAFERDPDAFRRWDVLNSDELDSCPFLLQLPFEEVRMNQIKDAANILDIPLESYIYYRQDDPRGIRSKEKIPTGYVHIKRLQQIVSKKNNYVTDIDSRSLKTGDVKDDSKAKALSEPETYALAAISANKTLEELLGPRADNFEKKQQMYRNILADGYVSLEDLKSTRSSSVTLNTINTYLVASGIQSDLITDTLETEYTLNKNLRK